MRFIMKSRLSILALVLWLTTITTASPNTITKTIPSTPGLGPTTAEFYSGSSPFFDGPKLDFINGSSFDWWYFDAVSSDGKTQLTITFFTTVATTLGFGADFGTTNFVSFLAAFPNGTQYQQFDFAGPVVIQEGRFGIRANWTGTGFSFEGSRDLGFYRVVVDSDRLRIHGDMTFDSVSFEKGKLFLRWFWIMGGL